MDKLKEFIALFSWQGVQMGVHEYLAHETDTAEKKLSNTFYKLFHETRLLLIEEFTETGKLELNDAIHHAQLFLNRLIFVLFAENNHKLPKQILSRRIHNMLESASLTSRDNFIYSTVSSLFESLDQAALTAVNKSRWIPAKNNGKKVAVWVMIPVVFKLK